MNPHRKHILILEPSDIVYEGLSHALMKSGHPLVVYRAADVDELALSLQKTSVSILIINPLLLHNRQKEIRRLKENHPTLRWIGLVYNVFPSSLMQHFHTLYPITDPLNLLLDALHDHESRSDSAHYVHDALTEREKEVLVRLVNGLSNKEIADSLNISTHTVISHRKNIIGKTGIKSQSGLTIYAITQRLISLAQEERL